MQPKPTWLDKSTILLGTVGSQALGLNTEESDNDLLGVCIEPIEERVVLGEGFQQYIYRSAWERTGIADAPSEPGDTEMTVYGLRKFCHMAASGNPSVMILFWLKGAAKNALGNQLQELAPLFVSKRLGSAFLGYMQAQHKSLLGQRSKKIIRLELIDKFGFDTKFAMHVLRLGYQGVELLDTGKLALPLIGEKRDFLMSVRKGEVPLKDVLHEAEMLEGQLKVFLNLSVLPEQPNRDAINAWMQQRYLEWWKAGQTHLRPQGQGFVEYKPEVSLAKHRTRLDVDMEGLNDEVLGRGPVQLTAGMESCTGILQSALGGSKE